MRYKYLQKVTKSYLNLQKDSFFVVFCLFWFALDSCLASAAFFGFSEETKSVVVAMLSPYYSRERAVPAKVLPEKA